MLNRINDVKPRSVPPVPLTHSRPHPQADHLLELIGDDSDADDVLSFFREMWPEVEGAGKS